MSVFAEGSDDLSGFDWNNYAKTINVEADAAKQQDLAREKMEAAFGNAASWQPNAQAAQAGASPIAQSQLGARQYQDSLAKRLELIAGGHGGGVAEMTARQNLSGAQSANNALAATRATPAGAAAAMRATGNTNQAMGAQGEARIAALKAQEQLQAQQALTGTLAGMRAQDFGMSAEQSRLAQQLELANAGFAQQTGLANQDAWQKAYGLQSQGLAANMAYDEQTFSQMMADLRQKAGIESWRQDMAEDRDKRNAATQGSIAKSVGGWSEWASEQEKKQNQQKAWG
jgi:hypothetical protein